MKLNWEIWSFLAMIGVSIFNILQILPNKNIEKNINLQLFYMRTILVIGGILAAVSFLIPGIQLNNKLFSDARKYFDPKLILGSAISLIIFNILLLFAFSKGGSLAGVIINLNLLIVILFGTFVMGEKTNMNIWLAVLVYLASGIYIVYEKNRISK
jgi:drug/metabolite transporter (DMT)-like permease